MLEIEYTIQLLFLDLLRLARQTIGRNHAINPRTRLPRFKYVIIYPSYLYLVHFAFSLSYQIHRISFHMVECQNNFRLTGSFSHFYGLLLLEYGGFRGRSHLTSRICFFIISRSLAKQHIGLWHNPPMSKRKAKVIMPTDLPNLPEQHEVEVAWIVARHYQKTIEFLKPVDDYKRTTADFVMDGRRSSIPDDVLLNRLNYSASQRTTIRKLIFISKEKIVLELIWT